MHEQFPSPEERHNNIEATADEFVKLLQAGTEDGQIGYHADYMANLDDYIEGLKEDEKEAQFPGWRIDELKELKYQIEERLK